MPDLQGINRPRVLRIAQLLISAGDTIAVSEASAGGLICAALLSVPGASSYFIGGGIIYTRTAYEMLLGITPADMAHTRSATEEMARLLARTIRTKLGTVWGLAETGAAGPAGNRYGDPAGHCCLAVSGPHERSQVIETGQTEREGNMVTFANAAFALLESALTSRTA